MNSNAVNAVLNAMEADEPLASPNPATPSVAEQSEKQESVTAATPSIDSTEDGAPSKSTEKPADTSTDSKDELPKSVNRSDDKVRFAFMKERNRRKKAEERFNSLQKELNELKASISGKSIVDSIDDRVKAASLEGQLKQLESDNTNSANEYEEQVANMLAEQTFSGEQLSLYNKEVAPYRNQMLKELAQVNPIVARYVKSSNEAPRLLMAFRGKNAWDYLNEVNSDEPMLVWQNMNALVERLKQESKAQPGGEKKPEAKPKISTSSANGTSAQAQDDDSIDWAKIAKRNR